MRSHGDRVRRRGRSFHWTPPQTSEVWLGRGASDQAARILLASRGTSDADTIPVGWQLCSAARLKGDESGWPVDEASKWQHR